MSTIGPNGEELTTANPTPEVGQVWADNDERTKGAGEFTIVGFVWDGKDFDDKFVLARRDGRTTRIRADRLLDAGSRGYRYIGRAR
jgi:hypothetical protein